MQDRIIARRKWEKRLPVSHPAVIGRTPCLLKAEAKLYALDHQQPYFSLTGELWRNNGRTLDSCGQMSDLLVREWPQLEIIALLHLSDEHGVPMHAVANGAYWLGFTQFSGADVRPDPNGGLVHVTLPYFPHFEHLWRVSPIEAVETWNFAREQEHPSEALAVLACAMLPRWQDEAADGLALLRGARD